MKKITATDAVRNFSEILNAVTYRGVSYIVLRGKKPVAEIHPAEARKDERLLSELAEIWKSVPKLGKDSASFDRDLKWALGHQPSPAKGSEWE